MAELSVEEAQRLARLFLTGLASGPDVQRLQAALADDQTLALELLAQVQTALDDVAPEGLDTVQAQSVAARIQALVAPRIKRRGFLSVFRRLFRARPLAEARVARRGAPPPPPAPAPAVGAPDLDEGGGLEDMAPIAPTVEAPSPPPGRGEEPPQRRAGQGARRGWLLGLGLLLAVGALLLLEHRRGAPYPARPVAHPASFLAAPPPRLSPVPTLALRVAIRRESALGSSGNGPLPAALPPTTPQSASQLQ